MHVQRLRTLRRGVAQCLPAVTAEVAGIVHFVEPTQPTVDAGSASDQDGVPDLTIPSTPVTTARRHYGVGGAMLAGGMLGLEKALEMRPAKQEAPIVVAAPTEPIDIDSEGIDVPIDDETSVYTPPQPRSQPHVKAARGRK